MIAALSQLIPLIKSHSPRFRQRVITGTNGEWRGGRRLRRREWEFLDNWKIEGRSNKRLWWQEVAENGWSRPPFAISSGQMPVIFFFCFTSPPILFVFFLLLASRPDTTETVNLFSSVALFVLSFLSHFLRECHGLWQLQEKNTGDTRTRDDNQ